jgi:phosphoglycolate phosphatase-like HAD superfamily hydrolase
MNVQAVSFDFDGVFVLDSDAVFKKQAWDIALAPYRGHYEAYKKEASELYGSGRKGGRVEIIQYIFEKLGEPEEHIPALVAETVRVFDEYVQTNILNAGLVPGALEMLEQLAGRDISLYLNSGTATSALVTSAQNLGIAHFFRGILGSTPEPVGGSKVDNLTYTANQEGVKPSSMLMVGDGGSDYNAAKEFGCRFLGVANLHNQWAEMPQDFDLVTDLRDVVNFL